jgi:hypothetical protein
MKAKSLAVLILSGGMLVSTASFADHNSVNGEGWANMPNDIHNTRIDTLDTDNETFISFVRFGAGASSTNRFLDDDDVVTVGSSSVSRGAGGSDMGRGGRR